MFKHRIEEDPDSAGSDLPDLNDADVAAATVKIQTAYRGFATRKQLRQVRFDKFLFSLIDANISILIIRLFHTGSGWT